MHISCLKENANFYSSGFPFFLRHRVYPFPNLFCNFIDKLMFPEIKLIQYCIFLFDRNGFETP